MKRVGIRTAALALIAVLVIGHSAGLQAVAWIGMFIQRLPSQTISEALVSTLDGAHPCRLCSVANQLALAEGDGLSGKSVATPDKAPGKTSIQEHGPDFSCALDSLHLETGCCSGWVRWPTLISRTDSHVPEPQIPPPRIA